MSEIVVETTPSETIIEIEGGPTLTTTVTQELQTLVETPAEPVVIDLNSGARGEPGSAILTGEAYPTLLMGSIGDLFIVTEGDVGVGDVYVKTVLGWVNSGNIRGPAGGIDTVNGYPGPDVDLNKADIGLDQADNTSDAAKPVSTAQQAALDTKVSLTGAQTIAGIKTFADAPVVPDASWAIIKVAGLQAALDTKAADSSVVHLAGAETVSGKKAFTGGADITTLGIKPSGDHGYISFYSRDATPNTRTGYFGVGGAGQTTMVWTNEMTDGDINIATSGTGRVTAASGGGLWENAVRVFSPNNTPTKSHVGLGSVDNTSDADKPVSTAQAAAIATKVGLTGDESVAGTKTFTGIIFVPAPTEDLHASTKKYVDDRVNALIDTSPETLNTLNELAAALGDDPNFATTVTNQIATKVGLSGDESISGIKTFVSSPVVPDNSWTISKTVGLQAALDLKAPLASPTFTGTVTAPTFSGALAATNLTGTIDVARMPSTVVLTTGTQTITGPKSFSSFITVTGINRSIFTNDTSGYTSASTQLEVRSANSPGVYFHKPTVIDGILRIQDSGRLIWAKSDGTGLATAGIEAALFTGSGAGLTDLNGTNIATGTVAIPRLPASVVHRVVHNGTSWPARPTGATYVEWVGPTAPGAATSNDTWVNTSV